MQNAKRLKAACYVTNVSMSVVANLSPLLFLTFRSMYDISYGLLGLLVLINFSTQLLIDLAFSFFSHKFNIPFAVKMTPVLTFSGLIVYAVWPFIFPNAVYAGLVIGTVIFASAGGLGEVLISPVIAAIPSDDPDRELSKLHSIYAWGVVGVIAVSTLFILIAGEERWQYLVMLLSLIPLVASCLYLGLEIPKMETPERASGALDLLKNPGIILCFVAMFLGGASECTMAQWSSGYLEAALGIPKVWGDICGVALFAVFLGLGRSLYAKYGKNVVNVLLLGALSAAVCYLVAAISNIAVIGLIFCALCGFSVSMLWPGGLIFASDRFPQGGVFVFALMAAGGDMGASVGPQLVGIVTDAVIASSDAARIAHDLGVTAEQLGMKLGMLFPLMLTVLYFVIWRRLRRKVAASTDQCE